MAYKHDERRIKKNNVAAINGSGMKNDNAGGVAAYDDKRRIIIAAQRARRGGNVAIGVNNVKQRNTRVNALIVAASNITSILRQSRTPLAPCRACCMARHRVRANAAPRVTRRTRSDKSIGAARSRSQ